MLLHIFGNPVMYGSVLQYRLAFTIVDVFILSSDLSQQPTHTLLRHYTNTSQLPFFVSWCLTPVFASYLTLCQLTTSLCTHGLTHMKQATASP